jgi:predicted P-loop ATPase
MTNVTHLRNPNAWMADLTRSEKGGLHATVSNGLILIGNDPALSGLLAYNEFSHQIVVTRAPPTQFAGAAAAPGPYPRPITDSDVTLVQAYLQRAHDLRLSQQSAQQACQTAAEQVRTHPVREWLGRLKWDGIERLGTWLCRAFGAPETDYHADVGTKMLVAAVRRIRHPGCKFDHVPVLEGSQGAGKSRACRLLYGAAWFKDDLAHNLGDKDAQQGLAGAWGIELAELQVLVRSTNQAAKAFFSRQVDHFRPSYGRTFLERPRQCVFIGTTNETDYLTDATGNRRYWPIRCEFVDLSWITENREQLWAEAADLEAGGYPIWLDDDLVQTAAAEVQSSRTAEDVWAQAVVTYTRLRAEVTTADILHDGLGLPRDRQNRGSEMRVAAILRMLGWQRHDFRRGGRKQRSWFAPGAALPGTGRFVPIIDEDV